MYVISDTKLFWCLLKEKVQTPLLRYSRHFARWFPSWILHLLIFSRTLSLLSQRGQPQGKQEAIHSAAADEKRKSISPRNKSRNGRLVYRRPMTLGVYRRTDCARLSVSVVIYSVQEKDGNEGLMLKSCLSLRSYNRVYNARKYSMSVDTFYIGSVV